MGEYRNAENGVHCGPCKNKIQLVFMTGYYYWIGEKKKEIKEKSI